MSWYCFSCKGRWGRLQPTRTLEAIPSGWRLQEAVHSTRLTMRHFELKTVLHWGGLHGFGLQTTQSLSCFGLQVSIAHIPQQALLPSTLPVCGGRGGSHTVSVQQRGLSLQFSNLSPEVFYGLFQLLDDVNVFFLEFC